ncbi:MAG: 4Fe-4S dicluster domain-containing protein [Vicinamibacterales bacterium]
MEQEPPRSPRILPAAEFDALIRELCQRRYEVIGPRQRDGVLVYDRVTCADDLPAGWTDEQGPAHYRLEPRTDGALFGFSVGPGSCKSFLHPADICLWSADRTTDGCRFCPTSTAPPARYAFIGVRPCDLAAILIQDRILLQDRYADPVYAARRQDAFIVAVQCTHAAATCFCASTATGPCASHGFDLALTELGDAFLAEIGSTAGAEVLAALSSAPATEEFIDRARRATAAAAASQTRRVDTIGLRELLQDNFDHPQWEEVEKRCLACGNCTMVCPTCVCTTIEDASDLTGTHAERWRRWDSCFSRDFSYIHGGVVRHSTKSRYRQWLTHKLSTWIDQFGVSGCVGCGRCITWCPVGIDLTEEVRSIQGAHHHGDS